VIHETATNPTPARGLACPTFRGHPAARTFWITRFHAYGIRLNPDHRRASDPFGMARRRALSLRGAPLVIDAERRDHFGIIGRYGNRLRPELSRSAV
jgi:hypothetical protein